MILQFLKHKGGNFATMFALALLPVALSVGVAVDYTNANRDRSRMQNFLDAALLSVGQDFREMEKDQVRKAVRQFLKANIDPALYAQVDKVQIRFSDRRQTLTATVSAEAKTSFMMIAGYESVPYTVDAQIRAPFGGVEVALVLDNTWSMSADGKLDALKVAAKAFVENLMPEETGGDTKIGIVPFSNHVNVGMSYRNADWLDVADDYTEDKCHMTREVTGSTNCRQETGYQDGVPYTYETCDYTYGPEKEVCGTYSYTWNGCVGSRQMPFNLEDRGYTSRPVPGIVNAWCGAPVTPLTDKRANLITEIDAMVANGDTYIPTGVAWGLRVLSSGAPFKGGATPHQVNTRNIRKIMVLMTDGENQRSARLPDHPDHWGTDLVQADDWTLRACKAVRDEDVTVYAITFGDISADTKSLIRKCATDPSHYYHAAKNSELTKVFEAIAGRIGKLHLSM